MAIFRVVLLERGRAVKEMISDPRALDDLFAAVEGDESFPCLRFLDPYGDTTFGRIQVASVLSELELLKIRATTSTELSAIDDLMELARQAEEYPHRFLLFQGE